METGDQHALRHGVYVAVCDGRKALLFENTGDAASPKFETREVRKHPDPPTRELGTDKPGRGFASVGNRRSAMENADWQDEAERAFVKAFAEQLDRRALEGKLGDLVIAAPPRALGTLRDHLGRAGEHLRRAFPKDLVDQPVPEIERHIVALMRAD